MIVDTSALIAIVRAEPEEPRCTAALVSASVRRMSAANVLKADMVMDRWSSPRAPLLVDEFMEQFNAAVEAITLAHVALARDAFHRFGRGSRQGAQLNFGDCFAYALARATDEPLLFVGNDFAQTDIPVA